MRDMRYARRGGGGSKSGWDVLPDPLASSSKRSRIPDWGTNRRHDDLLRGHGCNRNPRRSLSPRRGRYDDFDLAAADVAPRKHRRLDDRSPPSSLSPELWASRGAFTIERNFAGHDIHDGLYRGYPRSDPPSAARHGEVIAELGDFQHHRHETGGRRTRLPSPGADIDEHSRLIQRSISYLNNESSRRKFIHLSPDRTVHTETPSATIPGRAISRISPGDNLKIGSRIPHEFMYRAFPKVPAYDEEQGAGFYSLGDSSYAEEISYQTRHLVAASSGLPREDALPVSFRGELQQRPADSTLGQGINFRSFGDEPLDHSAINWSDAMDAKGIAHPIAYEPRGHGFSHYDWKQKSVHADGDDLRYPEFDRTYIHVRRGSPSRELRGTLEDQRFFEEDTISDYGEMEYVKHGGKPSPGDDVLHLGRNARYIREDSEHLNIRREARNARTIEMVEKYGRWTDQEILEKEFSPSRRSARFDHSSLERLTHNMSDSDSKRLLRKSGLESHRSMRDYDERSVPKVDPPKDSEEFKHLMHKTFLRFSKLLNGDSTRRDKYRQERKSSQGFVCYVCGSESKNFPQVHSLVTHAFHSKKAGLQAEHLGLHKALCVVLGWSWTAPPDRVKSYKKKPDPDVESLKEDLIIWPPIMIIRNLSSMKASTNKQSPVSKNTLQKILKKMKVDVDKVKIAAGKAGDKSVLLVKYLPTLSGLHEAAELHKAFKEKKRGREQLQDAASSISLQSNEEEESVYGYMGTVEDLDILDSDTKRRCILKSKKGIEDIADAPIEAKEE